MYSSIAQLSQQLFSFQRDFASAEQRTSLEAALDRVLSERVRPEVAAGLGAEQAQHVVDGVRTEFMRQLGSINPNETARFIHSSAHALIEPLLPPQTPLPGEDELATLWSRQRARGQVAAESLVVLFAALGASTAETARALGLPARQVAQLRDAAKVEADAAGVAR